MPRRAIAPTEAERFQERRQEEGVQLWDIAVVGRGEEFSRFGQCRTTRGIGPVAIGLMHRNQAQGQVMKAVDAVRGKQLLQALGAAPRPCCQDCQAPCTAAGGRT